MFYLKNHFVIELDVEEDEDEHHRDGQVAHALTHPGFAQFESPDDQYHIGHDAQVVTMAKPKTSHWFPLKKG